MNGKKENIKHKSMPSVKFTTQIHTKQKNEEKWRKTNDEEEKRTRGDAEKSHNPNKLIFKYGSILRQYEFQIYQYLVKHES